MPTLLLIETATPVCSVALTRDNKLLAARESDEPNIHSSQLTVFIQEALEKAGLSLAQVDAFAVSKGPGSYTGLRIGVSTAKGLCYALDKPLIAVSTLQSMASGALPYAREYQARSGLSVLLCPMIDARRMEVYTALYDNELRQIMEPSASIITSDTFKDLTREKCMLVFGNGSVKCQAAFHGRSNIFFLEEYAMSASHMITLAEKAFHQRTFEDAAYFEPYYLKDFIAGKPKVKGLD